MFERKRKKKVLIPDQFKPSVIKALIPLVPIMILVTGNMQWIPALKMGVAQAMLIGAILAFVVGRVNPEKFTKEFFQFCKC